MKVTVVLLVLQGGDGSSRWPAGGAQEDAQRVPDPRVQQAGVQGATDVVFLQARECKYLSKIVVVVVIVVDGGGSSDATHSCYLRL